MDMKVFLAPRDAALLNKSGPRPHTIVRTPDRQPAVPVMDTDEFTAWMRDHDITPVDIGVAVLASPTPRHNQ